MLFLTRLAFFRSLSFLLYTGLSNSDCRQQGKSMCYSVNWTAGDTQLEVLNASTGKRRDSGSPSRLCKHALFARWIRLYRKVSSPWHAALEFEYFHTIKQLKNSTQKQKYVRNHGIRKTYPDNLPLPLRFWNVQLMDTLLSHETKGIDLWKAVKWHSWHWYCRSHDSNDMDKIWQNLRWQLGVLHIIKAEKRTQRYS